MATNKKINDITGVEGGVLSGDDLFVVWDNSESSTRSASVNNLLDIIRANLLTSGFGVVTDGDTGEQIKDINAIISYLIDQVKDGAKVGNDPQDTSQDTSQDNNENNNIDNGQQP